MSSKRTRYGSSLLQGQSQSQRHPPTQDRHFGNAVPAIIHRPEAHSFHRMYHSLLISALIETEEDEVLFGIAEEIGKVWDLLGDPLRILPLLEKLCAVEETVVRD